MVVWYLPESNLAATESVGVAAEGSLIRAEVPAHLAFPASARRLAPAKLAPQVLVSIAAPLQLGSVEHPELMRPPRPGQG